MRVIIERPLDPKTPAVFAVAPGTGFPVGSMLMCMMSEFFLGCNIHLLLGEKYFSAPLAGTYFRLISCLPSNPQTIRKALAAGRNVCVGFSDIKQDANVDAVDVPRNKDFVRAAIEQGSQLIPVYCFWSSLVLPNNSSSFLPTLPTRAPLLLAIGRPIQCPLMENPSPELVNEYNEVFLREVRRLFDKYGNTVAYSDRSLEFRR